MATQTEPATSAIFRALRSMDVDPDLAYEKPPRKAAAKPGRTSSPPLEPRSTPKASGSMSNFSKIESQITEVRAEIKAQNSPD